MPQPDNGPAATAGVKTLLKIGDAGDDDLIGDIVDAVNSVVRGLPVAQLPDPAEGVALAWPANVSYGATMLAARLFRRKGSPSGVEAFGANGPVYVNRNDPDIAMLLKLGDWAPPVVG